MTRLSLHDRVGEAVERKLPICRMCCQLFATNSAGSPDIKVDSRIASFRPCGHVFHYACIMDRYQRMEDNCSCVTCFERYMFIFLIVYTERRMDELPIILFMEWSKTSRPVTREENEEIEIVAAPDSESFEIRDELGILKLKLDSLRKNKENIIRSLNDINDATALWKARCDGLDEICEAFSDRLVHSIDAHKKEVRLCEELVARVKRDQNQAVIGELSAKLAEAQSESQLTDFASQQLQSSSDPDDLLAKIGAFYDGFHRKVKEEIKALSQLKTTVHSLKKEDQDSEQRMLATEKAKLAKLVVSQNNISSVRKPPRVVDRKMVPMKQTVVTLDHSSYLDDDLAPCRKKSNSHQRSGGFGSLFN